MAHYMRDMCNKKKRMLNYNLKYLNDLQPPASCHLYIVVTLEQMLMNV